MNDVKPSDVITRKEAADREAWQVFAEMNSRGDEIQHKDFLTHKIEKLSEAPKFLRKITRYEDIFRQSRSVLELGAGTCWASYILKKLFADKFVVGTDISDSVHCHGIWQPVVGATIDEVTCCSSYDIPYPGAAFDLVFCFESAHHFFKHRRTLVEIHRILRPGGYLLYLDEPACRRYVYRMAYRRVNSKQYHPGVLEDVLIYKQILRLAESVGFKAKVFFDPHTINRQPKEFMYYLLLSKLPSLTGILPCTADFVFRKPEAVI